MDGKYIYNIPALGSAFRKTKCFRLRRVFVELSWVQVGSLALHSGCMRTRNVLAPGARAPRYSRQMIRNTTTHTHTT